MHTFKTEKHSVHYNSDLSGEIIINGNGDELNITITELLEIFDNLPLCKHTDEYENDILRYISEIGLNYCSKCKRCS